MHVEKFNLSQTHIMNDGNSVVVSGNFHAAFQGLDINTIKGELIGEEVVYEKNGQFNRIEYFTLDSEQAENRQLTLNSEIGQISLTGKFNFVDLTASIQDIIAEVLPGFKSSGKKHNPQDFEIVARINDFSFIQAAFIPELTLSEGTSLNLKVNEKEQILDGTFGSEKIMFENLTIKGAVADFTRSEGSIYLSVSSDQVLNNDTLLLNTIALDARSLGDTIFSSLTWGNSSDWLTGDVNGVFFLRSLSDLRYEFESSTITLNGEIWKFDERGEIDVCQNELAMQNFGLSNGNQYVIINGVVSDSPYEQITIDLNNIALAQLNPYLSDATQLIGELDGSVALRNLYESPIATADLTFSDLGVNSYQIGNMCVKSNWEPERKRVRVDGELDQNGQSPLRFAGSYYPFQEQNSLDFLITLNSFDLNVLNAFLGPDVLTLEGRASTMLSVKGEPNSPELNGELHLQETKIGVPFLKTTYTLSDKIKITEDMFTFSNVKLMDEENHSGVATGQVFHEEFQKWSYDVIIEMETPMLVMNTQEEDNSDFYGKAYATGYAEISGYDDKTEFEIVMKSEKGTTFNLPMSSSGDLQFDSFIRFVNPKDTIKKEEPKANLSGISLNMQLDVTEDAEFQVIFDEAVGDIMKGRGKGHLSLTVNQLSTLGMYGFLEVTEGTYLFTLKNLVNKPFAVKPGGYIAWYGDPLKGELDL
ncbi:MAG: translocation/assembly module TamB domain-containing protein, partial [Bacteroidota bacterium]